MGRWQLCPEHRATAPLGPQQRHFTERHTIAAKFSRCITVSVILLPVEAGVYLTKRLKPGGTPAAHVAHRDLSAETGSVWQPLPPTAPRAC